MVALAPPRSGFFQSDGVQYVCKHNFACKQYIIHHFPACLMPSTPPCVYLEVLGTQHHCKTNGSTSRHATQHLEADKCKHLEADMGYMYQPSTITMALPRSVNEPCQVVKCQPFPHLHMPLHACMLCHCLQCSPLLCSSPLIE